MQELHDLKARICRFHGVWLLTAPDRTGPYPTASDSPDRTSTMTSYKNRVLALSAKN